MQRAGVPPPLSPLSMSSNDSSVVGRYGGMNALGSAGTPTETSFSGGPYLGSRPPATSSPPSQHPSSSTDMSRPSGSSGSNRPPSSASSIASGRIASGKPPPPGVRNGAPRGFPPENEDALRRHYHTLKTYLAAHLQAEKANPKSNRARDKLLRLSATQFLELSTDVFDEMTRREDERLQRLEQVPRALPPKPSFHPKRNQARQKLSTLPIERFRQLATDVFYELERRVPRIGAGVSRPGSAASGRAPSMGGGMRPPPGHPRGPPGSPGRMGPNGPMSPYGSRRPSEAGSMGRPQAKQLQSNTIVPNKGTMVEDDDDDDDDEDAFGLASPRSSHVNSEDQNKLHAQESEIVELKERLEELELKLAEQDEKLSKASGADQKFEDERSQWRNTREELEQRAMDAEALRDNLRKELDEMREGQSQEHEGHIRDLHAQLDQLHGQLDAVPAQHEALQRENDDLRREMEQRETARQQSSATSEVHEQKITSLQQELEAQQKLTTEVREEATMYLREMRGLSRQNNEAIEQEEKMSAKLVELEREIDEWRQRYARVKAHNRHLRASSKGLGLQNSLENGEMVRQEGLISEGGLVRGADVTRFQLAVDELLKAARRTSSDDMLKSVKNVVVSVQAITSAVGTDGYPTPAPSPPGPDGRLRPAPGIGRLQARVTGTANSLITAAKQHAASMGLSPVALLDAAASNVTAAVIELIKAVHIRSSTANELQDRQSIDEIGSFYDDDPSSADEPAQFPLSVPAEDMHDQFDPLHHKTSTKKNGWFK